MLLRPRPAKWLSALCLSIPTIIAQSVPSLNLDLNSLGNIAVGGNFDAISVYSYLGQQEGISGNGTQAVLSQLPSGVFDLLASTDATIQSMCPFVLKNGTLVGIVVGGNFTSVGGVGAQALAFIDATTSQVTPHPGIQGTVNAVLCDQATETVYVGGTFEASISSNAITWTKGAWANMPFSGFDAPVTSIVRAPDGHIVFGGSFSGLKNGSNTADTAETASQVINLSTADVTSVANTTSGSNIVCPSNSSTNPQWLLQDNTAGSWTASLGYGFEPAKLRLYNIQQGSGTKTWRFTALPNGGIMNFTYTDPATGDKGYCDATCPLAQNSSLPFQDFYFVNTIGMNSFRIDVSAWYGSAGGLVGIELFQNDTFVYAVEDFNEPACLTPTSSRSSSTATGSWFNLPSRDSNADYLGVVVGPTELDSTSIVFEPDLTGTGNYSVVVYTPGCIQDSTCSARGVVNVTGTLDNSGNQTFSTQISQTNDYEKYDEVFLGKIDGVSSSFRPSVTITPSGLQSAQYIVASRVKFSGNPSTGGLNGLFDFDPNSATVDTDFSKSAINSAGTKLKANAQILCLARHNDTIFSGGVFSDDTFENIMLFANNSASSLPFSGLNAAVRDMYTADDLDLLYVGGNFSGTSASGGPSGMNNVAGYSVSQNSWVPLGSGLDGPVDSVEPMLLNISTTQNETVISFSGSFKNINAVGSGSATPADGFAIWVPSANNWLVNLHYAQQLYYGQLSSSTIMPNGSWLGGGTLQSLGQAMSGAAALGSNNNGPGILQLPISIQSSTTSSSNTSSLKKRATTSQENLNGVTTGLWDTNDGRNITIMAGHFTATTNTSTIHNLLFLNGGQQNNVTGLPSGVDDNSTFYALAEQGNLLFAGGAVTGQVNGNPVSGLVVYDLKAQAYSSPQPAGLTGQESLVNAIVTQGASNVYVGGSFDGTSQGLSCSSVCMYDTGANIWSSVGGGLGGTVSALYWIDKTHMLAAGNLTVSGNSTSLAEYDSKHQTWSSYPEITLPGPATAFASSDSSNSNNFWVSGTANNGSTYLVLVSGNKLNPVVDSFGDGTVISGMEVLPLTKSHGSSQYFSSSKDSLMVMGQLNLTGYGQASTAVFNGTTFTPFLLSVSSAGSPSAVRSFFHSKANPATSSNKYGHSNGLAVLVAFCAALGTIFLIVLVGMILNRIQRRRAGYSTVPSVPYHDKNSNITRVPPDRLFNSLGQRTPGAPAV